jgi:hypothetical protein
MRAALEAYHTPNRQHKDDKLKFSLYRIRINNAGYDSMGRYWGVGNPLWTAEADFPDWKPADGFPSGLDFQFRATDRERAKAMIREVYPNARFYR